MEDLSYLLHISSLIKKQLSGALSTGERQELDRWLAANPDHARYLEAIEQEARSMDISHPLFRVDVSAGVAVIEEKIHAWQLARTKKYRMLWQLAAAAAILLAVVTGIRYAITSPSPKPISIAVKDLPPGSTKAQLLLSNGSMLALGASGDTTFNQGTAVQVSQRSGQLTYHAGNDRSEAVAYNTLITPRGGEYHLTLPDGTEVWLNAGSSLHFPVRFSGNTRTVELNGEAFFDVAARPGKPFTVIAGGNEVVALGTSFNINAYQEEGAVRTTLVNGLARVDHNGESSLLNPGNTAVSKTGDITRIEKANVAAVLAWKNGLFLFKHTQVSEVMQQVGRWYNVSIKYAPDFDNGIYFSGEISRKVSLSKILTMMEKTGTARFSITDSTITVAAYH